MARNSQVIVLSVLGHVVAFKIRKLYGNVRVLGRIIASVAIAVRRALFITERNSVLSVKAGAARRVRFWRGGGACISTEVITGGIDRNIVTGYSC